MPALTLSVSTQRRLGQLRERYNTQIVALFRRLGDHPEAKDLAQEGATSPTHPAPRLSSVLSMDDE
jgi:hypothetical protein